MHEARLLDEAKFDDWLALFTADGWYWVPSEPGQDNPHDTVSLIYDDRRLLETRVRRLASPRMYSQEPRSRTSRIVANVTIEDAEGRAATVRSQVPDDRIPPRAAAAVRRHGAGTGWCRSTARSGSPGSASIWSIATRRWTGSRSRFDAAHCPRCCASSEGRQRSERCDRGDPDRASADGRHRALDARQRACGTVAPQAARVQASGPEPLYVPVGLCSAVLVRCRTSHFDLPASASALARMNGGQVVGQPSISEMRWVCSVSGRSCRSQVSSAFGTSLLAVEIDRHRQRVHHRAAAALPDVRRQRMRGVADHRDPARRPALELDVFEAVVAASSPSRSISGVEMREPALPRRPCRPAWPSPCRRSRAWSARYRPRSRCTACRARAGCRTSIRPWSRRPGPLPPAVLSIRSRVQPSTRYLRLAIRPRLSRTRELAPSAAITRSAFSLRPSASVSSPSRCRGDRRANW